ncbi:hypothetical protein LTR62_006500 [Meristemomyces frigidus]|uniref:Palmitoyltransferase n=1 Tax=Meristemomyces frigidus TaxID=1508187 RepID=A0AAN7TCA8_9PEZI|nr:hypothetical protein LTR62_006500 [Meristemomyces frigidus]
MADERPVKNKQNKASLGTAKVVPVVLVLIVAYASYVVVGPLSINYLFNPPENVRPRIAAGIAIPILWFALLLPVAVTYLRLLLIVTRDPGYVPLGSEQLRRAPPSEFWMRDVFVCDPTGKPIWCSHCENWKPDRTHHNQDVGRCTLKMDHFCPWVGGVVGERSVKFFLQFLVQAMILCLYLTIVMAYFVHEHRSNLQWDIALGLAAFFLFFTLGMVANSLHLAFLGMTTIEHANRDATLHLAVLLPPELQPSSTNGLPDEPARVARPSSSRSPEDEDGESERPLTSEIDDPSHSRYFINNGPSRAIRRLAKCDAWRGTITYPLKNTSDEPRAPASQQRTFAILETPPGLNPWDLGTAYRNFTSVFGHKLHHWLFPFRAASTSAQTSDVSAYPLGPQFEDFLDDVGLVEYNSSALTGSTISSSSKRKRKRKVDIGWQNGERPDGYITEKEIRRQKKEARRLRERANNDLELP